MDGGYFILLGIAIVFLPGILWAFIDSKFSPIPGPNFTYFIAKAFVFGIVAYFLLFKLMLLLVLSVAFIVFWGGYFILPWLVNYFLNLSQIGYIFYGIGVYMLTFYLTPIFAKFWFKIKDRDDLLKFVAGPRGVKSSGGIDVWTGVLMPDIQNYRIKVIDSTNKRIYVGDVDEHSVSEKPRELFLSSVYVYNLTENPEANEYPQDFLDYVYIDLREGNICVGFIETQN